MSRQHNNCFMARGRYNWADPSEVQCQLIFTLTDEAKARYSAALGDGKRVICGFTFDPDYEDEVVVEDGPLAAAESLLEMVGSHYLFWSNKKELEALASTLKDTDAYDRLGIASGKVERLKRALDEAIAERDEAADEVSAASCASELEQSQ